MHDAGTANAADAGEAVAAMRKQGVYECLIGIAWGGVHDQAGRLVDDDQVVILEADFKRYRLRLGTVGDGWRKGDREALTRPDPQGWIGDRYRAGGPVGTGHLALENELFQPAAREITEPRRQHTVETLTGVVLADDDDTHLSGGVGKWLSGCL